GRLTAITDRYGNVSAIGRDALGRISSVSDPAGRGTLTLAYDTCFSGRLCSVTDWSARAVHYGYDASGRLISATDRNNQVTHYAYDGSTSHLTSITDANNHVSVTMTYDAQGRVATQKDALGITTGQPTVFAYDSSAACVSPTPPNSPLCTTTVTYPAN